MRANMGRRRSANFRERTPADSPNLPETHQSLQPHLAPRHTARSKLSTRAPPLLLSRCIVNIILLARLFTQGNIVTTTNFRLEPSAVAAEGL